MKQLLAIATLCALASIPAMASAPLKVNANGFHRVVVDTGTTPSCNNHRTGSGRLVICPQSSRGTMTLYRHTSEGALCEIDFWPQSDAAHPWRAVLSHPNTGNGTCSLHWRDRSTIDVTPSTSS
jgi:hypothetical protein